MNVVVSSTINIEDAAIIIFSMLIADLYHIFGVIFTQKLLGIDLSMQTIDFFRLSSDGSTVQFNIRSRNFWQFN